MNIKNIIQKSVAALLLVFAFAAPVVVLSDSSVNAAGAVVTPKSNACQGIAAVGGGSCGSQEGVKGLLKNVTSILLFVIGAISIIMIIVGGIKYVTSAGDQSQLTSAKNTILYAIVGLVIASASYAIVVFVVDKI